MNIRGLSMTGRSVLVLPVAVAAAACGVAGGAGDYGALVALHDEFLASGWIPISLIRWEMTGYEDEVRDLFGRPPG